jgi:hypothetical protein
MLPGSTPSALPFLFMTATPAETMGASVGIVNGCTGTSAMAPWPEGAGRTSSSPAHLSSPWTCIMAWVQPCERPRDQRLRQFVRIGARRVGGVADLAYSYGSPLEHPVKKPRNFQALLAQTHAEAGFESPPCPLVQTFGGPWIPELVYRRLRRHRQIFPPAYWGIVRGCCTLHTRQTNQRKEIHLSGNRLR